MKYYALIIALTTCLMPLSCFADHNDFGGYPSDRHQLQAEQTGNQQLRYHPKGDVDRDGVPNYRDQHNSRPQGDIDNDGINNARDKHNNNRDYRDKDHDGIANIRDDHDNRLDKKNNNNGANMGRTW